MVPVQQRGILGNKWISFDVDVLELGKVGKLKDLSNVEKDKLWWEDNWVISKMLGLVEVPWNAVVKSYQKWPKEVQPVNQRHVASAQGSLDVPGEWRLTLFWSHTRASIAKMSEKSEYRLW